ncbi:hypothetical protein AKJ47_01275 [candidate division MSBL1 archaeon SCGC-AAA261G05]|uniref:Protein containing YHS domain protein n=1 Tax=candidate division MSBL1 archaeon SCGC-AAA261G05 TaxID=1698276 RepID=A0A133VC48_9EURY|nr:hypothetical protein AKJ47_01275 [candidate division MSBL1 archaeon SCGC-AAA261G05]
MKCQIGVIGSSEKEARGKQKAKSIGREIAKAGCHLLTGGCTGLSYAAIEGAKEEGGFTVGISPAIDQEEHLKKYGYPIEGHDLMVYTGFGYKGRNVILVRSCDGVVATSGRMGTLNELTIAHAEGKVMGLLKGVSGAGEEFEKLAKKLGRPEGKIITSENPKKLVQKVLQKLDEKTLKS